jgi:hypothetical protein
MIITGLVPAIGAHHPMPTDGNPRPWLASRLVRGRFTRLTP